jgi:hypothetical protein
MSMFDYGNAAEFFPTRRWRSARSAFGYKRFPRAADAIRYVIEELPPDLLVGAFLEVDEERFDGKGIRELYDSTDYPYLRAAERKRGSGAETSRSSRAGERKRGSSAATAKKSAALPIAARPKSPARQLLKSASAATSKIAAAH